MTTNKNTQHTLNVPTQWNGTLIGALVGVWVGAWVGILGGALVGGLVTVLIDHTDMKVVFHSNLKDVGDKQTELESVLTDWVDHVNDLCEELAVLRWRISKRTDLYISRNWERVLKLKRRSLQRVEVEALIEAVEQEIIASKVAAVNAKAEAVTAREELEQTKAENTAVKDACVQAKLARVQERLDGIEAGMIASMQTHFIHPELMADKEVVMNVLRVCKGFLGGGNILLFRVSEELQADKEVVMTAVTYNGWELQYASDELKADKEVVMTAVISNGVAHWQCKAVERNDDGKFILTKMAQQILK